MDPIRTDLPSRVEETLAECPRFRILVVGRSGVGKSSLVKHIFNLDENVIDIARGRAGTADIDSEYTSDINPRFVLHDSQGFEPGKESEWKKVDEFIRKHNATSVQDTDLALEKQIHAIWLCIETPRTGSRLLQDGDEKVLDLADYLKIPIIVVLTKYDLLVNQYHIKAERSGKGTAEDWETISQEQAKSHINRRINDSQRLKSVKTVDVSSRVPDDERIKCLNNLSDTTLHLLYVQGKYTVLWATAQQVSAKQKVKASISEGFKKYWVDLGRSTIFRGRKVIECLWRIHDDILKVWNLHDPEKLLSGEEFLKDMVLLVEPMMNQPDNQNSEGNVPQTGADVLALANYLSPILAQAFAGAGLGIMAVRFLYEVYENLPRNAQCLGAYIVDLTVILHNLFMTTLATQPPRAVTRDLLKDTVNGYKIESAHNHRRICLLPGPPIRFETKVKELIYELFKY